jgi:hypothetical protein
MSGKRPAPFPQVIKARRAETRLRAPFTRARFAHRALTCTSWGQNSMCPEQWLVYYLPEAIFVNHAIHIGNERDQIGKNLELVAR